MEKVIFLDEKSFSLDKPDYLNYYFHELKKKEISHYKGNKWVMVVQWFGQQWDNFKKTNMKFVSTKMNSKTCANIDNKQVPKYAHSIAKQNFNDNSNVHTAKIVKAYFKRQDVLSCPAKPSI